MDQNRLYGIHRHTGLLAMLFAGPLLAQPTLLSSEMAGIGTINDMRIMATFSAVDTSVQGANVTWDFTGLAPDLDNSSFVMQVVAPASTPNGSLFPTSNYAWIEIPNNWYRYFSLTGSKLERVGSFTTTAKNYIDPQIEYVFPLTMGTSSTDTWETETSDGTYSLDCIGHGTLLLPGDTYDDVLMVRVHATELGFFEYWVYFWYSSDNGSILVQYVAPLGIADESGLFTEGVNIGMAEHEQIAALQSTIAVDGRLLLGFQATVAEPQCTISSTAGALVKSMRLPTALSGSVQSLNVADLPAGVYLLNITAGDACSVSAPLRFVKG